MTLDPKLRGIFAAADETIAELDRLHAGSRARQIDWLAQLRAVAQGLDAPSLPDEPEQEVERPQRHEPRRPSRAEREYEIADEDLPQRKTSRGGPYGPAVRSKLVRIALDKGRW